MKTAFARFADDRSGNFTVLTAAAAALLVTATGLAVNLAQITNAQSGLANALDAALVSTARDLSTGKIKTKDAEGIVTAFLAANFRPAFASGAVTLDSLIINKDEKTISASASVPVSMAFPMPGSERIRPVTAQSGTLYSDKKIEVSMVLDITGSMSGKKLDDLKIAARNAVKTFLGSQDPADPRVRIALVPYAAAVNAGPLAEAVHVEKIGGSIVPPANTEPFAVAASRPDDCATERKTATGEQDLRDVGPDVAMVNRDLALSTKACPAAPLLPLTAKKKALNDAIDAFKASGSTAGHIGIEWGWHLISPEWKSALSAKAQPADYADNKAAKYAIIMTDGEFNTAYVGSRDAAASNTAAEALCGEMKARGVEVFTIGFMLNQASAKAVLKACASPDKGKTQHAYDAADGAALDQAFQDIAANIEKLTVTK